MSKKESKNDEKSKKSKKISISELKVEKEKKEKKRSDKMQKKEEKKLRKEERKLKKKEAKKVAKAEKEKRKMDKKESDAIIFEDKTSNPNNGLLTSTQKANELISVSNRSHEVVSNQIPVPIRKPVSIRAPGSSRQTRDINPVYSQQTPITIVSTPVQESNSFIIRGVNDTDESRLLVKTFADKWYLPANLYRIEAQTGLKYRRGRFTDEERDLAKRLTLKFCKDQSMTLDQFKRVFFDEMGSREVNTASNSGRLSNFFVEVAQHFGGRPVVAIYECLKRLYHPGNHRGPWTPEEDQILLQEYQKYGPKWSLIGKELNRLGINCRDRYNLRWKHSDKTSVGPWNQNEEKILAEAIQESLRNSGTISWIWVAEERLKTRTPLQCVVHYKSKSFKDRDTAKAPKTPKPTTNWNGWKSDEDYLLIYAILNTNLDSETLIDWRSIKVEGIPTSRHNYELFFRRWNFLKSKAEIIDQPLLKLANQVEKIKKYLIGQSKTPAYIFSEDDDDF